MDANLTRKTNILRVETNTSRELQDTVIEEKLYSFYVNSQEITELLCSPVDLKELAAGFLFARGIITGAGDLDNFTADHDREAVYIQTSSSSSRENFYTPAGDSSNLRVNISTLQALGRKLEGAGAIFRETGGAHGAALCTTGGEFTCFFEDVSRHNTLYKVLGYSLLHNIPAGDKLILFTGRVSSEILAKTAVIGASMIATPAAPTAMALEMARQKGITVAGFLRGTRVNIYTYPERVQF